MTPEKAQGEAHWQTFLHMQDLWTNHTLTVTMFHGAPFLWGNGVHALEIFVNANIPVEEMTTRFLDVVDYYETWR